MEIANKNLFVAERVLALYGKQRGESRLVRPKGSLLSVSPDGFAPLPLGDFHYALSRLAVRDCFVFENGDEYFRYLNSIKWNLTIKLKNLKRFIALANDNALGIKKAGDKKIVVGLIDQLLSGRKLDLSGKPQKSNEVRWMEWIEDYSGAVKVKRRLDFGLQGSRYFEPATATSVVDRDELMRLRDRIRTTAVIRGDVDHLIVAVLSGGPVEWRCADCNRYLFVTLSTPQDIKGWLQNFKVDKYRKCKKNGVRNYFTIGHSGKLMFKAKKKAVAQ